VTPNPASAGSPFSVAAKVNDEMTGGSGIAFASYMINGGSSIPMAASDGAFGEVAEEVTATVVAGLPVGVHNICVFGIDVAGNAGGDECTFLAVYDPSAGFVTGGGWIDSPAGAFALDPTLTGKAQFGFVSKYQEGAHVPTGTTEFQFKAGNLNFHSDSYQWLVVAGARAQFKGVGTVNGMGNFGFMLTAVDEALTPSTSVDLFRIKIWDIEDGDAVIYDNQMGSGDNADPSTAIGGGSIVIHKQ